MKTSWKWKNMSMTYLLLHLERITLSYLTNHTLLNLNSIRPISEQLVGFRSQDSENNSQHRAKPQNPTWQKRWIYFWFFKNWNKTAIFCAGYRRRLQSWVEERKHWLCELKWEEIKNNQNCWSNIYRNLLLREYISFSYLPTFPLLLS